VWFVVVFPFWFSYGFGFRLAVDLALGGVVRCGGSFGWVIGIALGGWVD